MNLPRYLFSPTYKRLFMHTTFDIFKPLSFSHKNGVDSKTSSRYLEEILAKTKIPTTPWFQTSPKERKDYEVRRQPTKKSVEDQSCSKVALKEFLTFEALDQDKECLYEHDG